MARISAFRDYSVVFVDNAAEVSCFVLTWDDHSLLSICVRVEPTVQRVPYADLAGLSRVVGSLPSCQLPLSCHGGSPSLVRVLNDSRVDGRQFVACRPFTKKMFVQIYQESHQSVLGELEVTSMIDFLVLRLRAALQEPWMEDVLTLRRCVVSGQVAFKDLRAVASELIPIWKFVREFVRFSGPRHIKCEADRVILCDKLYVPSECVVRNG